MSNETKIDDGGPAFPVESFDYDAGMDTVKTGLSIRDWFAAQMLPRIGMGWPNKENRMVLARQAYEMADTMLAARQKREG